MHNESEIWVRSERCSIDRPGSSVKGLSRSILVGASNGLDFANDQNQKIIEALTDQKSQHQEIMSEQKEE